MIGEYTLFELCKKYNIDARKMIEKNNNILISGNYVEIDNTLDYLINELKILPRNIEKCPSILYRNVSAIRSNISFLMNKQIDFSNVESCLHVLATDPKELMHTYFYVLENYGLAAINKNTSVLIVKVETIRDVENLKLPFSKDGNLHIASAIKWGYTSLSNIKEIIESPEFKEYPELFNSTTLARTKLEEIRKIIQSKEFKEHPELFTSQTLAYAKLEEIRKLIQSPEFKLYPKLFTSQTLAHSKIEDIQAIIHSSEFREYPELFTSETLSRVKLEDIQKIIQSPEFNDHPELFSSTTIARTKLEEIRKIIQSPEFKEHPELFTSQTLAHAKLEDIQKIIQSPEFREHPELFTSTTLAYAKIDEIQKIIQSPEFKEHPELFTSTTLAHAKLEEIQKIIQSPEFMEHPELFTSETLVRSRLEDIQSLLKLDYWQDDRYKKLLTSSILSKAKSMINKLPILFRMAEEYHIDKYINTSFLLHSPSHNYALICYLKDNNIPLVKDEKINHLFSRTASVLNRKYGVNIKELINKYPLEPDKMKEISEGGVNGLSR